MTALLRLFFLPAAALAGLAGLEGVAAKPGPAAPCVAVEPEPSSSPQLRPMPRAVCNYDVAELDRRIRGLLELRSDAVSIEAVERLFGLPAITTLFDSDQSANYGVEIAGAPGKGEWRVLLDYSESFFPMIPSRPKRFRGSLRPVRINPNERGDIQLRLMLLAPRPTAAGAPGCIAPDALAQAGAPRWKSQILPQMVMDAGPMQSFEMTRGKLELSADVTGNPACLDDLTLTAPADPPVPGITAEEEAQMRLRSAETIAAQVVAGLGNAGDADARRAYGQYYRDSTAGNYLGAPDPLGKRIDGLDVARLRDLLKRVATGSAWGLAREDCEAAILEPETPAALLRRARARGLDEVEVKALETYCNIYLQGRLYRPPAPQR
jgi:hypothetical protein